MKQEAVISNRNFGSGSKNPSPESKKIYHLHRVDNLAAAFYTLIN